MNGVRSISMRKGYLLTALAAAVLLAASSGTAYAQGVGFVGSSSRTMMEGASPAEDTAAPIEVEFNVSGLTLEGDGANAKTGLGMLTLQHNADDDPPGSGGALTGNNRRIWLDSESTAVDGAAVGTADGLNQFTGDTTKTHLYGVEDGGTIPYDTNGIIKLILIDPMGDGDWVDGSFTMTLRADAVGVTPSPATVKVTVMDGDPQPTVSFSKASVNLTEDSQTSTAIAINLGAGKADDTTDDPGAMDELTNTIQFTTSPAGAASLVVSGDDTTGCNAMGAVIAITAAGDIAAVDDTKDTYSVTDDAMDIDGTDTISIRACMDDAGFRDDMVTFSFVEKSLTGTTAADDGMVGNVAAGPDLVVTVQSEGEDAPVVSFATTSIAIDEGSTNTVAILADGELGTEVGSVMVSMSGDAMLSLWQGDDMLEAGAGGMFEVMLGTADKPSANTILTISADSDRDLEDGMTSSATLTIESASGATIGGRDSVTVTVSGSTAVAALPLLAQLLLALFLMAGGARLYRRRNG